MGTTPHKFLSVLMLLLTICRGSFQQGVHLRSKRSLAPYLEVQVRHYLPEAVKLAARWLQATVQHEARYALAVRRKGKTLHHEAFESVSSFLGSSPEAKKMSYAAFVEAKALSIIKNRFKLDRHALLDIVVDQVLDSPLLPNIYPTSANSPVTPPGLPTCPYPQNVACSTTNLYRTYDGRCNNLHRPLWGASFQPLGRFIYPDYADGIEEPRQARDGSDLPNARLVSLNIHDDKDSPSHIHTLMLMQFGQFLDHDLSRTAISKLAADERGFEVEDVQCGDDGCQTGSLEHATCWPIWVPQNDTDFRDQRCLMFVRTIEVPNQDCDLGPRQQLNQVTAFLDGSHIYGSTKEQADQLRDYSQPGRGRLRVRRHPFSMLHKSLLPPWYNFTLCKSVTPGMDCFLAGDTRVNEHVGLMTMHTLFVREHNRLEEQLHQLNPHWQGERLFQETRRIVVAMWQHYVYNEYLPVLLGPNVMRTYKLTLQPNGYYNGYDSQVKMNTANVFATAAFRFGHSQVQSLMRQMDGQFDTRNNILLSMTFRMPSELYDINHEGPDSILRGLCGHHSQSVDNHITKQVTRHLFSESPPSGLGTDLASLNIQRGRDHGLPGYNTWRDWCGIGRVRSFQELANSARGRMREEIARKFQSLYKHVDDIDLFPAGISEIPEDGSVLGPTLSCIIATQFRKIRHGDRYWYENFKDHPYPFTQGQLTAIRRTRLSKVICNNGDFIRQLQPHVLLQPADEAIQSAVKSNDFNSIWHIRQTYAAINSNNNRIDCNLIPDININAWRETSPASPQPASPSPQEQVPFNNQIIQQLQLTSAQLSLLHMFGNNQQVTSLYSNIRHGGDTHQSTLLINPNIPPQILSLGGPITQSLMTPAPPVQYGNIPLAPSVFQPAPNANQGRDQSHSQRNNQEQETSGTHTRAHVVIGGTGNIRYSIRYPSGFRVSQTGRSS